MGIISDPATGDNVPTKAELARAATRLYRLGWCVIPLRPRSKEPAIPELKVYRRQRPPLERILADIDRYQAGGLAVNCGPVSEGLAVRDFDVAGSYHRWAETRPDLARVLPTVATRRGFHVYHRIGEPRFKKFADGEYRGSVGAYVVAPPSAHEHSGAYDWLIEPTLSNLPVLDPEECGLLTEWEKCGKIPTLESPAQSRIEHKTYRGGALTPLLGGGVAELPSLLQPTGPGERNHHLWSLARTLKRRKPNAAGPEEFRALVEEWWGKALGVIRTQNWDVTWSDFCRQWEYAGRQPGSGKCIDQLAQWLDAHVEAPPGETGPVTSCGLTRLDIAAEYLQAQSVGQPFPLSVRVAARLARCSVGSAHKLLARLVEVGTLILVLKGEQGPVTPEKPRAASTYLYRGAEMLSAAPHEG